MFTQAAQELTTVRDILRFAVSRFNDAGLFFGHGSDNAHDEAAYLILHTLNLPLDTLEPYLDAKLLQSEKEEVLSILERRAVEHIPAAYLTHQAWQGEFDFYVDERVIVPRSFIYELLGDGIRPWIEHDELVHRALDLCTGSGCLAIQMAHHYPDAQIDAVDLSLVRWKWPRSILKIMAWKTASAWCIPICLKVWMIPTLNCFQSALCRCGICGSVA